MTADQWQRVRALFERALEEQPSDVRAWLALEAADDPSVRAEVSSLLDHHTHAGSFLAEPVAERIPELLAEDQALTPGQTVGPYTIVRELGRGGMGRVYLSTDTRLGRTVALKALSPDMTANPSQRERLRREARAAASLAHPGICTIYALEEIDGDLYIAAEYIEGPTLREEIEHGARLSAAELLQSAREIAAALASAHARGITHRDLKPENVMRDRHGRLKILDFGLARVIEPSAGPGGARGVQVTLPGAVMGTPAYMAPEQLNGQLAGPPADVFAFGVLIYELASGTHPFHASTPFAIAARVLEGDPQPVEQRRSDTPPVLASIIARCLRQLPDDRFASAAEVVSALTKGEAGAAAPVSREGTWWRTHQLTAVALYFIAAALAWLVKELTEDAGWDDTLAQAIFLTIGIAATIGGVFRGHLLFTERRHRLHLAVELRRATPVTLIVDLSIAAALMIDGLLIARPRALTAVLTCALAVGIALARVVVEPSTTRAELGPPT